MQLVVFVLQLASGECHKLCFITKWPAANVSNLIILASIHIRDALIVLQSKSLKREFVTY